MNYLVSIIIPVYNTEKYIAECLESVLSQYVLGMDAQEAIEMIIVNDGSPDNSLDIINTYKNKYRNILVMHQKNSGQSVARNNAIEIARGEYIFFLDSDDLLPPGAISSLYKLAMETGSEVVVSHSKAFNSRRSWFVEDHAEVASSSFRKIKFSHRSILMKTPAPWGKLYKTSLLVKKHIRFPLGIKLAEDWIFVLRAMYYANHISSTPHISYLYRGREDEHNPSCTQEVNEKVFYDFINVYKMTYEFKLPETQVRLAKLFVLKGILYRLEKYSRSHSLNESKKIYKSLHCFFIEHIGKDILTVFTPQRRLVLLLIYYRFYSEAYRVLNGKIKRTCYTKALLSNDNFIKQDYFFCKKSHLKKKINNFILRLKKPYKRYKWSLKYQLAKFLSKIYHKDDIVLMGERLGTTANDTSYFLFKKAIGGKAKNNYYYVIKKDASTIKNLEGCKNVVHYGSIKHFVIFIKAHTYVFSDSLRDVFHHWSDVHHEHSHKQKIFLQHGIFATSRAKGYYDRNSMLRRHELPDKFIVSSDYESTLLQKQFGFNKNELAVTGLTRFDYLPRKITKNSRTILFMPTWREWLTNAKDEVFLKSQFFVRINSFLLSHEVHNILETYGYKINVCIHHQIKKHIDALQIPSENISFYNMSDTDVQGLLISADLMITDYSSASFDVLYQNKPVIFYHFDAPRFFSVRGGPLICPLTEFPGPVYAEERELIDSLKYYLSRQCRAEAKYIKIAKKFFTHRDGNNSKRVLRLIEGAK
ncbi:bifunctional glycosyltransferase/CDP-glycerol:glycerophosphate glycerophosphotransferase [Cronobacter dublinensis]|uniref:bifunctional glycosyltransferase/CDP-glycerol:glycerophosphate glycerophosphotransferase n=1 Tax=Cronobacter dublinensis TaxID=413497 RepID=UPI0013754C37|nr:CDP-glycerol glycerophosphotransferase family protein [Cronobacter dublinensis]NCH72560.1 glycosyltransferase [Cronobacter dublinensis]